MLARECIHGLSQSADKAIKNGSGTYAGTHEQTQEENKIGVSTELLAESNKGTYIIFLDAGCRKS